MKSIDAGEQAIKVSPSPEGSYADFDGDPRDDAPDIGADEL